MPTIIASEICSPFPHFHNSKVLVENLIKSGMCGTHLFQGFLACICKTAGRILGHGQFHRVWLLQRSRDSGLKGGKFEGMLTVNPQNDASKMPPQKFRKVAY